MADDDPKLPLNEPAPQAPADDGREQEQVTTPPEGDKPEGEHAERQPSDDYDLAGALDDDEQDDDDEGDEGEGDGEDGQAEKRSPRNERYRRQAERLRAENEALRNRQSGSLPSGPDQLQQAFESEINRRLGPPPDPKEFGEDYVGLSIARQAYETDRRIVRRDVVRQFEAAVAEAHRNWDNLVSAHQQRVERFKGKVKDYDEVMAKAKLHVENHVQRLLLQSKKSERLAYVLARNEGKLAQLNRMAPEEAAREIGRLEGRLSLPPQARTKTKARRPITPLKGAGAAPANPMSGFNAWAKKTYGDRA